MKNISEKKTIDVTGVNFSPIATFKQGDAAVLKLELFKNGEVFNITGQTVKLGAYRPNKTIVEQLDGFTIDNNALTINLKNNILAVHGIVEVDLTLTDLAGEMTTASFYIKVNKKVLGSDNIAAADEIDSLKQIKIDLTALNENVKREENTRVENEKNRVSEEKIRKTSETERIKFYEGVAKPLTENLKNYDAQITKNTKSIVDNTKDIERAFDTINDGSFLPFEGENVTIEHSKVGFTKDMVIEGRTYHNLNSKKYFNSCPQNQYIYHLHYKKNPKLIEGGKYTIINTSDKIIYYENPVDVINALKPNEKNLFNYNYTDNEYGFNVRFYKDSWGENIEDFNIFMESFMILEGDYTNKYIPSFFTGIKSVGEKETKIEILSNGKNLFNVKSLKRYEEGFQLIDEETNTFSIRNHKKLVDLLEFMNMTTLKGKTNVSLSFSSKKNSGSGIGLFEITYIDGSKEIAGNMNGGKFKKTYTKPIDKIIFTYSDTGVTEFSEVIFSTEEIIEYQPYKSNKKELLLPYEYGHKSLPDGTKDTFIKKIDGLYFIERVGKIVLDGNQAIYDNGGGGGDNNFLVYIVNGEIGAYTKPICDKFACFSNIGNFGANEGITQSGIAGGIFYLSIAKSKLISANVNGVKAWLQANPTTVYYKLASPIEHKISNLNSINLETFKDITHVFSENEIKPNLSFKAPVDVPATISSLRTKNTNLEHENKELKDEINTKALKLHDQDVELTNSDLDLDFRIFELEMNIGLPINLNIKGVKNMARSPFEMMKILILNNNYDREDIEYKASRYLKGGRMTQEEYNEIISLMDTNELVK